MEKIPKYIKTPGLHNKVDFMRHFQGLQRNKHRAMIKHHVFMPREYFQNETAFLCFVLLPELDKYYVKKNSFQVLTSL